MKRVSVVSLFLVFIVAAAAHAHKGEVHSYIGTITRVTADSLTIKTKDGKGHSIKTSKDTTYTHSDNHKGKRSELKAGTRAVVKISKDGETAENVKFSAKAAN